MQRSDARVPKAVSCLPAEGRGLCAVKSGRRGAALTRASERCISHVSMRPRTHNLLSYSVALLLFVVVIIARFARTGDWLSSLPSLSTPALLAVLMWCFHFARRTAESAWVHRYGKPQVPLGDVLVEYLYYWGFAVWIAVSLTPEGGQEQQQVTGVTVLGAVVFVVAELGNARAHRMLRDLRPPGSNVRVIPRGFLFERVSSPHYLFEISSWLGFALVTQTWAACAFLVVGAGILGSWARARHVAYRKDFDGREGRELYPASRRALIPGLF
jgi:very-long-chain enoyl-CoA reductase